MVAPGDIWLTILDPTVPTTGVSDAAESDAEVVRSDGGARQRLSAQRQRARAARQRYRDLTVSQDRGPLPAAHDYRRSQSARRLGLA